MWHSRLRIEIVIKYECENMTLILKKKVKVLEYKKHHKGKTGNKVFDYKDKQRMIYDK